MDVGDYWQENKRFLVTVGSGLVVFLIGTLIVGSVYGDEVKAVRGQLRTNQTNLKKERYTTRDRDAARDENEALKRAVDELKGEVAFVPREEFQLQAGVGSASNQYFGRVDRVREELERMANRRRMSLPDGLGLEALMTTQEEVIVRHLEALDLIDRVIRLSLDAGVSRIGKIQVRLDPKFGGRQGLGQIERTQVKFDITSAAEAVVGLLASTQSGRFGQAIPIADIDIKGARSKKDEVRASVTFVVVRLHGLDSTDEEL